MLFIYGTLRQGGPNRARIATHILSSRPTHLPGALYVLSTGDPAYVPSVNGTVVGELVELYDEPAAFLQLDAFEKMFDYRRIQITLPDKKGCWVYVYKAGKVTKGAIRVANGDYLEYLAKTSK